MSIQYRKQPPITAGGLAAYVHCSWAEKTHSFYAGLLVIDMMGRPVEFVHNTLVAPTGFLWPREAIETNGIAALVHTLFDACKSEPVVLFLNSGLGSADFWRGYISPAIPCALVVCGNDNIDSSLEWTNTPPSQRTSAWNLVEDVKRKRLLTEPFDRIVKGLREVYPDAGWHGDTVDK